MLASKKTGMPPSRRAASPAKSPKSTAKSPKKPAAKNGDAHGFEFGGPPGAVGVMFGLPLVVYLLFFACGRGACASDVPSALAALERLQSGLADPAALWSWEAAAVVFGWVTIQAAMNQLLPGAEVEGVKLRDGSRLKYRMNGHLAFWVSLGGCAAASSATLLGSAAIDLAWLYDHYVELATASLALSVLVATASYAMSFASGCMLADGGHTGYRVYDYFIGRPLNPRLGSLDLKAFCELRPGLIGWAVLNLGMAAAQLRDTGSVSGSMVAVNAFQLLYVWDALHYEQAILTTMDITTDGFGYMLAFGDLTWVPFTYSLQARVLVDHDPRLGPYALAAIVALDLCGYTVFRGANSQKDAFRRDPTSAEVAHLQWMPTKRGTKLLVSGFWGLARKVNYTGDWMMGLAWCLTCGFTSVVPYFYAIYFAVLLIHRAVRDDHFCSLKYGDDWAAYKKKVPAVFVPGLI